MTFSASLSNALSGMNAATTELQVRSHNIANAGTSGYARREVSLTARGPSGGVRIETVVRLTPGRAGALALAADAASAEAGGRAEAAAALTALLGLPGDDAAPLAALARFEGALADLQGAPEDTSVQASTLAAAQRLTESFASAGRRAQALRQDADAEIALGVGQVNDALGALHELNRQAGGPLSDLPERRQAHLDTVAEWLDVRVAVDDAGRVRIVTTSGVPLLGEEPRPLAFAETGAIDATRTREAGTLSGLSVGGIDLTPGGVQGLRTGRLAAAFAQRDESVPRFSERLDALAETVAARVAEADRDGAGNGLLTIRPGPGAATTLAVNAAADPAAGGALWRLRDGVGAAAPGPAAGAGVLPDIRASLAAARAEPGVTGGSAALGALAAAEAFSSALGTEQLTAETRAAALGARAQAARDTVLEATGVNTDAELQSVLTLEQAYAANARVLQVASDMMRQLLEI